MTFTILGASGFVGSHLTHSLSARGIPFRAPGRDEDLFDGPLGHVIYCIGLTADWRARPFDTVRAHVCHLLSLLERADYASFLYLSSTRVYGRAERAEETVTLSVNPLIPNDLYDISKIMGESVCLSMDRPTVRVVRLSNVYGRDFASMNFLPSIVWDAIRDEKIVLRTTMASAKDYVSIDDVVALLPRIAGSGQQRLYNVASGMNTTNGALLDAIQRETGCAIEIADNAETIIFPLISTARIHEEFGFTPRNVLDSCGDLIAAYREQANTGAGH